VESFIGLALAENVEVAAGAELGEEARPARGIERRVKSWQKRVIHHLQNLSLNLCPRVFVPGHQFLLVHHLCRQQAPVRALQLHQVHASDVATPHALHKTEVTQSQGATAALYGVPARVRRGCVIPGGERPLRARSGGRVVGVVLGGGVHCVANDSNNNNNGNNNGVGVCYVMR